MIDIAKIWHDAAHRGPPVLVKRQKGDLLLRMTFSKDNRSLIEGSGRADWLLRWNNGGQYWSAPRSWFSTLTKRLIERHGHVWVIQEAEDDSTLQPCAAACMHVKGLDCVCGCGGKNHGLGDPDGWAHAVTASGSNISCPPQPTRRTGSTSMCFVSNDGLLANEGVHSSCRQGVNLRCRLTGRASRWPAASTLSANQVSLLQSLHLGVFG